VPESVPLHRSRAESFDALVLASVDRLEVSWGEALADVDVVVLDVPPPHPGPEADPATRTHPLLPSEPLAPRVPLGRAVARAGRQPPRLVLYRRPIELRAGDRLPELVHAVVVEQVARLLGRRPDEVDPHYDG
jgi:hypothetical protein